MAELLGATIQKWVSGGPDEPPKLKLPANVPAPEKLAKEIAAPAKAPTIGKENANASVADERRRILASTPDKTQTEFAGDADAAPGVKKKRLLGAGTTGKATTGE